MDDGDFQIVFKKGATKEIADAAAADDNGVERAGSISRAEGNGGGFDRAALRFRPRILESSRAARPSPQFRNEKISPGNGQGHGVNASGAILRLAGRIVKHGNDMGHLENKP